MNAKRATLPAALILVAVAATCIGLRTMGRKQVPPGDSFWRLTYEIDFTAKKNGAKVSVAFPSDTAQAQTTLPENPKWRQRPTKSGTRELESVASAAGPVSLSAQFDIHLSPGAAWKQAVPAEPLARGPRRYLGSEDLIQVEDRVVRERLERLRDQPVTQVDSWMRCSITVKRGLPSAGGMPRPTLSGP